MKSIQLNSLWRQIFPGLLALTCAFALVAISSPKPAAALEAFFLGPFRSLYQFGNLLSTASLFLITGSGIVLAMRSGKFNLGGEGQVYTGALCTVLVLLNFDPASGPLGLILALLVAAAAASLAGAVAMLLERWLSISSMITSYLISVASLPFFDSLISGPLRDQSSNLLATPKIAEAFLLPRLLPPSSLNITSVLVLLLPIGLFLLLRRSRAGLSLAYAGSNPNASSLFGLAAGPLTLLAFSASAALHGLAGGLLVVGVHGSVFTGIQSGYGWNGISAALIGKSHPLGVIWGALLFAYLQTGVRTAMIHTQFSSETGTLVQAIVFLLVTISALTRPAVRRKEA